MRKRFIMLGIVALTILLGIATWTLKHNNPSSGGTHSSPVATGGTQSSVSPLLFGTNLSLFDGNDQVLNSAGTRSQLQQMHIHIIRMPVRSNLSNDTEIQAAQAIKSIGAFALVILRGAVDNTVLADDTRLINDMNSVFGNAPVYYEYGNEEDLLGVDANRYTSSWNAIVPQLKHIALNGQFIGPVNYHYDRAYLSTFLQHADPRPDEISWHEYSCDDSWSNALCIAGIDHWTDDINDARRVMTATTGKALPIMITEWNYAPNARQNDGKINDASFMSTWTTKALETLAANHIFASMQYACTNSVYALIRDDGTLTAQGVAMKTLYQRLALSGKKPVMVDKAQR
jgi:hypothetical protein